MHEDLLRHIWSRQLIDPERLVTSDGRAVRVSSPGNLSRKSGPDFREARIEIGGVMFTGDVEFHRTAADWLQHDHQNDPNFNSVILHVVLFGDAPPTHSHSGRVIPTVVLEPFLLSSVDRIADQLSREEHASRRNEIPCTSINDPIEPELIGEVLTLMYRERLQEKILLLHERLCDIIFSQQRSVGEPHPPYPELIDEIPLPDAKISKELLQQKLPWEHLLYEQLMDALGYSNNRGPMKQLAESVPLHVLKKTEAAIPGGFSPLQLEAVLFRASGLLPVLPQVTDQDSKVYLHLLLSAWNELPQRIALSPLQPDAWNFSPTRPSNFPTIRIATASVFLHRLLSHSLLKSIIVIVAGRFSSTQSKIEQLIALFDAGEHPFWNYHYSFAEAVHQRHAVLGRSRTLDILVNVIVPFSALYAKMFGNAELFDHCLNLALELPLLEENSILKRMEKQLMKKKLPLHHAYQQQGLLQLQKRYCSTARCTACSIGKRLQRK
ncbi:MAG: DUF2851 family protein [Bacteroidota bacterium]